MKGEEYLKKNNISNRTIRGSKPKGQFPEYSASLIELLEDYKQIIEQENEEKYRKIADVQDSKCETCTFKEDLKICIDCSNHYPNMYDKLKG